MKVRHKQLHHPEFITRVEVRMDRGCMAGMDRKIGGFRGPVQAMNMLSELYYRHQS